MDLQLLPPAVGLGVNAEKFRNLLTELAKERQPISPSEGGTVTGPHREAQPFQQLFT
jgi:hypothetical protein